MKMHQRNNAQSLIPTGTIGKAFRVVGLALVASAAIAVQHAQAAGNSLLDISHSTLAGNKQQLALTLSGPAGDPKAFTIDNPARIALDLPDTENMLEERNLRVSAGLLQNVTTVEANGRTRVVINLASMTPYSTSVRGNQLFVTLESDAEGSNSLGSNQSILAAVQEEEVKANFNQRGHSINGIDFRRGPLGEGRIMFDLSSAGVITDMREEGGRVVVEFPDTQLAEKLQKRLDVMDFGTPIQYIDAISNKRGTRVIIQPATQEFEQLAYQSDNMFTVELKPMSKEDIEENRKAKFGYVGEKLSLNFQDIEVRSVLQLLADFTDLNIVVSDSVQGKLTLRLKNTPWDQALDIILQSKALGKREAGNVIMIAPAEEIATRERIELEGMKQKTELSAYSY